MCYVAADEEYDVTGQYDPGTIRYNSWCEQSNSGNAVVLSQVQTRTAHTHVPCGYRIA